MSRVLVVCAHMDDEVCAMGGAIVKHVDDGDEVRVLFMCDREYGLVHDPGILRQEKGCARKAREILGYYPYDHFVDLPDGDLDKISIREIISPIEEMCGGFKPHIAYVPWGEDVHQDHQAVFKACMIAMRPISKVKIPKIYCYETPSTTDQNPWMHSFRPNVFVSIAGSPIAKKVEAIKCYKRELRADNHPRSGEGLYKYAAFRGLQSGFKFAEAFMLIRELKL